MRRTLGREPVQVSREERDLADVRRLDEPGDPTLQADREAAVRRDAAPEGLDVRRVGGVGVAALLERSDVVGISMQALGAADQLDAAEDQVERAAPVRVV